MSLPSRRPFGQLADGTPVTAWQIGEEAGLTAEILDFGSTLRRLRLRTPAGQRDVVLALPSLEAYVADRAYLGVVAGRVANRIGGAAFTLDGVRHRLTANEGPNQLHGGVTGFGKRPWRCEDHAARELTLSLRSPAGEEGYPGTLHALARWRVEGLRLTLELEATTDAPTPVSLTGHAYFNLSGDPREPLAEHWLRLPASRYLPVDAALLPLGAAAPVAGTPFDFRVARPPVPSMAERESDPQLRLTGGYDHCWLVDPGADCVAELSCPASGIALRLAALQPGVQFYGGHGLARQQPGLGHGLCLEPEGLPNAVNQPQYPPVVLRPGERWYERISYDFSVS